MSHEKDKEKNMHLILWRHAEAEPGTPDDQRQLTPKGRKQAAKMARWMKSYLPKNLRILASPAARAQETARALDLPYKTMDELAQGKDAESILAAIDWPQAGSAMIVGHNPAFGQIGALLLAGQHAEWSLKKGGIWWFTYQKKPVSQALCCRLQ